MTPLVLSAALLLECQAAEARWALPPLLLCAVVLHESGGRQRLVVRERDGHCSVGAAQVLVPGCERERVQRLLVLSVNLDEGARVLVRARERCRRHPRWAMCRVHFVGAYNGGSRSYASRVLRVWRRLLGRGGEA